MIRRNQAWVAGVTALVVTFGLAAFATPLRRSPEQIQRWVLERAPPEVDAFWGFDAEERLIDFHVRKDYDSL